MKECPKCGMFMSDIAKVCPRCNTSADEMKEAADDRISDDRISDAGGIKCPKCGSTNISITIIQTGSVAKPRIGLIGRLKVKEKTQNEKRGICQNCGHDWKAEGFWYAMTK